MTSTTKSPSSIIEKLSYKDKKCDQLANNHLKQEILHKTKHYLSSLQQANKTAYMDECIKVMQGQIASLISEKNAFIKQQNNNVNNNNSNNNIINRNNNSNNNNDDNNNALHKTSNSPPNISNNNNPNNILNGIDNDDNNKINGNNKKK